MHANVYTTAVLTAREGRVDELLTMLGSLADATRRERGCIEYGFYRDSENPQTVLSFERWVDSEAEDLHWETPHLKRAIEAMGELLESPPRIFKTTKAI